MDLTTLSYEQLTKHQKSLKHDYEKLVSKGLKLDLTRGKPSGEQLDLSNPLLSLPGQASTTVDGVDVRNFGVPQGLKELRTTFSHILDVPPEQLLAEGNSSIELMYDCLFNAFFFGTSDSSQSWQTQATPDSPISFLCPVPGFDRHFSICEKLGIQMIPIPLHSDGPDMDMVEHLVKEDPLIKGIWCVPQYSNPSGISYSEETVNRLASMETAASDFRIMWDNAYAVHHLYDDAPPPLADILSLSDNSGNPERALVFASTSKITFAGAGIAFFGASPKNVEWFLKHLTIRTIGPDKINQLRHALFFPDTQTIMDHMQKHSDILTPKFRAVETIFSDNLTGKGIAKWSTPRGGYFVNLDVLPGSAKRTVELALDAGIALTPAGSTFPYRKDPGDSNLRIAPSYPEQQELEEAITCLTLCIELAALETLLDAQ